jgi:hypothetical protein
VKRISLTRWLVLLGLAASLLLAPRSAVAAPGVVLRYRFVAGQRFSELQISRSISTLDARLTIGKTQEPLKQRQVTATRVPLTISVRQVYADRTAQVSVTYGAASITQGSTTTRPRLQGYAVEEHLAPSGAVLATSAIGAASIAGALRSLLPRFQPVVYPDTPVHVGSTWSTTQAVSQIATLRVTYTVRALGAWQGHPIATLHAAFAQPLRFTGGGLQYAGTVTGVDDEQVDAESGAHLAVAREHVQFRGSITGNLGGKMKNIVLRGSFQVSADTSWQPLR